MHVAADIFAEKKIRDSKFGLCVLIILSLFSLNNFLLLHTIFLKQKGKIQKKNLKSLETRK